ncbi:PAS domain-containing protein [Desulfovibrio sp. TomC]|uniref:PAS domain-containing protein n=1 Tax=Desulfovibrio sp. TomC TaxID=1562888 RepID=UPI000574B8C7|nr:PAS domain-containing protein [Desulfovibrio sp. TomC]KHK00836.1 sensory box histidine kinase/response regulator [Desulfovibrio sp. TomC]
MAKLHETPLRDLPPASPLTLGLWTTAAQAARTLLGAGVGEALVLDGGRPLGVVTTRGLARVLCQDAVQASHLAVRDVMDPVAVSPESDYLPAALRHLLAAPSRRLAVVDATGRALGMLAPFHVARLCGSLDELADRSVASAMARAVVTGAVGEKLSCVLGRMVRMGVGGVVVTENDKPRGMFTARDAVRLLAGGTDIRDVPVEAVMRAPVAVISPQLPLAEGLAGMDGAGAGRLAVTDPAGYLLGLLTWTDVAAALAHILADAESLRLREQAERFRDLYDNASQGLFRLDVQGRMVAANSSLARLFGYRDVADCLRQSRQAAHPLRLDVPERRNLLVRALSQPEPVAFETRTIRRDGDSRRVYCVMRTVRDSLGSPLLLEGSCADFPVGVPPESMLAAESGYRSIVEHQTELICRFDPACRLTFVNAAFARYWGKTPEACIEENFQPAIHDEEAAVVSRRIASLCPHRPTTGFEHRVLRPDGRVRWQRWTHRAIFDAEGELVEYQAVGRDITSRKLAQMRLRQQHTISRAMLEALPLPVYYKDTSGRYNGCNQAFERLLGIPRGQLIGGSLDGLVRQHAFAAECGQSDAVLLAKGGVQVVETALPGPVGLRELDIHKTLVIENEGGDAVVRGIVGVVLDVTEQRRAVAAAREGIVALEAAVACGAAEVEALGRQLAAQTAESGQLAATLRDRDNFLEAVLAGIQDGVCVLSPDMTVLSANRMLRGMYPGRGELVGQRCHDVFHGLSAPCQDCPSLRAMATRKLAINVVPKGDPTDTAGWVELFCYPLLDAAGAVTAVVEIVRDVTAGKKLEAELAAALERAEAASQAKGAFLANMSHEIRTPLNAVLGYVQLMLRDRLEPSQRQRLAVVEESASTLLSIINDILDYSKIEAGRLEIKAESFDLPRCLDAVVKEQEVLARDKGLALALELGPDLPGTVRGDGLRLRQILRNLVNNAVKYTERGSVVLRASLLERSQSPGSLGQRVGLRFAVVDTGVGIPGDQLASIFDSFTQVDGGLTKRQAGTGLGLAICRRLAGLLGGGVFVDSTPGKGSVFWLECPFEVLPAAGGRVGFDPFAAVRREMPPSLRILLVEDNRVNRIFASDLLESRGHEVVLAENGRVALDYLAAHAVDVVLMDIQMPVMDGLAATRAIRAGHMDIDPGLPVVGLSAYAMDQERERFLAAGFDDYIIKPIDVEIFFSVVAKVLARRGRAPVGGNPCDLARLGGIIDTDALVAQYRGKAGLLSRVGREFVSSVPEQLSALGGAMQAGDLVACERVAHTLKGNAAMFGAGTMRDLAAEAEQAAASGDVARVKALAPALTDACQAVATGLDEFLCRLDPEARGVRPDR